MRHSPSTRPLWRRSPADDIAAAESCFAHLTKLFSELASYRAFELLRSQRGRTDYMLTKQARVIAMTCTHAALTRAALLELRFAYDSVIMEEAAQVTEVETLLPLLLQQRGPEDAATGAGGGPEPRLKRLVLIGDHHQLPPVVQNMALQKYARLDQSLFARLVRLGVPTVQLNMQGRARPAIAKLYNWRYNGLADLPSVRTIADGGAAPTTSRFACANAGFAHTTQLVDVPDYDGRGESTPLPHFYQVRDGD